MIALVAIATLATAAPARLDLGWSADPTSVQARLYDRLTAGGTDATHGGVASLGDAATCETRTTVRTSWHCTVSSAMSPADAGRLAGALGSEPLVDGNGRLRCARNASAWSCAWEPAGAVDGELVHVAAIGAETSGLALKTPEGLVDIALPVDAPLRQGTRVRAVGYWIVVPGVERGDRHVLDVLRLVGCPPPGDVDCMPPTANPACGVDRDFIADCPGVRILE